MSLDLTLIWALLIATAVFLYVVMDGFDLGVGILFPAVRGKADRDLMVNTVAPVWDGNDKHQPLNLGHFSTKTPGQLLAEINMQCSPSPTPRSCRRSTCR
jgi:Cytochrome bd terminal oxidase subunit II